MHLKFMKISKKIRSLFNILVLTTFCLILLQVFINKSVKYKKIIKNEYYLNLNLNLNEFKKNYKFNKNNLCRSSKFYFNNSISYKYVNESYFKYKTLFDKCENYSSHQEIAFYKDLLSIQKNSTIYRQLIDNNFDLKSSEFYLLKLNLNYFKQKNISVSNYKCSAELFDKTINRPERDEKMFGKIMYFKSVYNYEIVLNQSGFYYIACRNRTSTLHNVYSILPRNMSLLKERTNLYLNFVENIKLKLNDSNKNPMLSDLNFDDCEKGFNNEEKKLNVLIIYLDSMSYNQFKRVFPISYNYLKNTLENNLIFNDFNVVGEKTYPNILPLLTGLVIDQNEMHNISTEINFYRSLDSTFHDNLPFIWKKFHKLNYLTAYNEDLAQIGIFNLVKYGFRFWPTDFYSQPFWFKYHKIKTGPHLCHDSEPTYKKSLNLIKNLIDRFNSSSNSYFSFNFLKYYTHDYLTVPKNFDSEFKNLIENFEQKGMLKDSLFLILGDHGNRLSSYFVETEYGKIERSKPFLSIRLPQSMWNTEFYLNSFKNQNKLLTSFDLYKTLMQFYYMNKIGLKNMFSNYKCRDTYFKRSNIKIRNYRGISIFENIPNDRSCSDALIPNTYCTCAHKINITEPIYIKETNQTFESSSKFILDSINNLTNIYRSKCVSFNMEKILNVKKVKLEKLIYYQFTVILKPNNSIFESNLILQNEQFKIYGNILRISLYGNESKCMNDHRLHGFCLCKIKTTPNPKLKNI